MIAKVLPACEVEEAIMPLTLTPDYANISTQRKNQFHAVVGKNTDHAGIGIRHLGADIWAQDIWAQTVGREGNWAQCHMGARTFGRSAIWTQGQLGGKMRANAFLINFFVSFFY